MWEGNDIRFCYVERPLHKIFFGVGEPLYMELLCEVAIILEFPVWGSYSI